MTTINSLNKVVDPTLLREAMKELGNAYGIKDKNTFMQLLLSKAANDEDGKLHADEIEDFDTNPQLKEFADTILSLQGRGSFGDQVIESIKAFCNDPGEGEEVARKLKAVPGPETKPKDSPFISITQSGTGPDHENFGFLRDVGVDDIITGMGQNPVDGSERKTVTVFEFHDPLLNFANRGSAASSIFLQALPSIEISKAVPFFDMKAIVRGDPTVENADQDDPSFRFGNGISIYKFLSGERIEADDLVVKNLVSAIPVDMGAPDPVLEGRSGGAAEGDPKPSGATEGSLTVAGMEVFTSPQTLVRGDFQHVDLDATGRNYGPEAQNANGGKGPQQIPHENKVLDKFRPLMTIESFNITTTPATGMLATKKATAKIKLHDKTRLNQIVPFIQPAKLGLCDIQVEWGWSHPVADPAVNPYGALINSMRCKELYGVMNTAYTFTPEGQVDITIAMFSKGAQRATFELVTAHDGKNPADVIRNVVMELRSQVKKLKKVGYTINEEMGAPDVFGKASSVSGLLGMDPKDLKKIEKFINKMAKKKMSTESKAAWKELGENWGSAQEEVKGFHKQLEDTLLKEIEAACAPSGHLDVKGKKKVPIYHDPYLLTMQERTPKGFPKMGKYIVDIGHTTHVSFAKLVLQMVAKPILASSQFHDVQLLFYPMNEFAMFARDMNVGQYPINKKKLKDKLFKQMKKSPSITIQKFLNMIKKTFINFTGDDIYGMSKAYREKKDDEGKYEIMKDYSDTEKGKQKYAILKSEILKAAYPEPDAERRFKKPSIQMFVECVQHENDPKLSILRLHFFDKACTSYSSYAQLWSASSGSDLGIIGKYSSSKKAVANVQEKLKKAPKKEKQKLQDLEKNRLARMNRHGVHAARQVKIFEKNGLIKPIKVGVDDGGTPIFKYQIAGGPDQLRGILAANMPTLKYGTEFSGILNASLQTNSNPQMETIHMQRQGGQDGTDDGFDAGLPMTVKPVTLSIDTFGCPYVNFGQQFFVDFQTNTTIDDIYAVSGVQHALTPTEFKSSIKLTPLNKMGQYRNVSDQFDNAVGLSDSVGDQQG